jgi:hypothetical protein
MESILPFGYIEIANNEVVEYAANIGGHAMNVTENNMMSFEQWMAL